MCVVFLYVYVPLAWHSAVRYCVERMPVLSLEMCLRQILSTLSWLNQKCCFTCEKNEMHHIFKDVYAEISGHTGKIAKSPPVLLAVNNNILHHSQTSGRSVTGEAVFHHLFYCVLVQLSSQFNYFFTYSKYKRVNCSWLIRCYLLHRQTAVSALRHKDSD